MTSLLLALCPFVVTALEVDLSDFDAARSGATVAVDASRLTASWPVEPTGSRLATLTLDLAEGARLIEGLSLGSKGVRGRDLLASVDPALFVVVGTRVAPPGRPPGMSPHNVFFDTPAKRPHETHHARFTPRSVRVVNDGVKVSIFLGELTAGPFRGLWCISFRRGSPLITIEARVRTDRELTAYLYDAGLIFERPTARRVGWFDTEGRYRTELVEEGAEDRSLAVRHRLGVLESRAGSLVVFPPPHRYFFPRDKTDNLEYVWRGRGHRGSTTPWGIGIRQSELGGGGFVPWFDAPPGSEQRLAMYLLPVEADGEEAARAALRYTRGDRFADVPGYTTFTSHWHMAITVDAMNRKDPEYVPDWVRMFKEMNVRIIHLGEFHGDGHPRDPGELRLAEMDAMFAECRRLSDDRLLVLPGEEANVHFGLSQPGRHPGHYMLFFPKPVTWVMTRKPDEPFESLDPNRGKVYRVGSLDEMQRLVEQERGLAWVAHPRIKASSWTPDIFRDEAFFRAPTWLGAAWKAMPADLSRERLGDRCLDLLSDMANWGARKYMPGEVDVFKIDHTHELFGHMNINYLEMDRVPRFDEGWEPVLERLRSGRFWVSTGEVLIPAFRLGGRKSGETLTIDRASPPPRLRARIGWTFPIAFAELVTGDGTRLFRERWTFPDAIDFGEAELDVAPRLQGRSWARLEVWDEAGNGAFTQPIWIESR
ncbi:MAG: hypothetical protein SFX72_08620 [Isosphaeraceae bacterium]|nr:hypothetical protein [Isosphaeraceae bacterium]